LLREKATEKPWVFFYLHSVSSHLLCEVSPGRRYIWNLSPFLSLFSVSFIMLLLFFLVFFGVLSNQTRSSGLLYTHCLAFVLLLFIHHCVAPLVSFLKLVGFLDLVFSELDLLSFVNFTPTQACPQCSLATQLPNAALYTLIQPPRASAWIPRTG
jgi:hypothetical protein